MLPPLQSEIFNLWLKGEKMDLEIFESKKISGVPSASGISKSGSEYFVVGDDSPFLFCLDQQFREISKTRIFGSDLDSGDRIEKKDKPDFEAMEGMGAREFAIFGSGSKSPERDQFVRVLRENKLEVKNYLISDFYNHLKRLPIFKGSELNIEAAASFGEDFFLFNRRKNLLIRFHYGNFIDYLEGHAALPELSITEVSLPEANGIQSGFSGATSLPDRPVLVYTASVEDTDNAYDDGEILGSFLGLLDIRTGNHLGAPLEIISSNAEDGPLKVESVAIDRAVSEQEFDLVFTTDSDGGDSLIMRGRLRLQE